MNHGNGNGYGPPRNGPPPQGGYGPPPQGYGPPQGFGPPPQYHHGYGPPQPPYPPQQIPRSTHGVGRYSRGSPIG